MNFNDNSVPKDDPIHNARNALILQNTIEALISQSNIVIILTGMYANYSYWIDKELQGAEKSHKPILAVNPWGQQRTSRTVQSRATKTVGWNKQSVLDSIVRLSVG